MSEAIAKLKPILDALTAEERAELADYLLALNSGAAEEEELTRVEWEAAWAEECERRMADLEAGKTKLIPGDEVMKRLKEKYG